MKSTRPQQYVELYHTLFVVVIWNFFQNDNSFHYTASSVCILFVLLLLIHFELATGKSIFSAYQHLSMSAMPICANDKCTDQAAHTLKAAHALIADRSVSLLIFSL